MIDELLKRAIEWHLMQSINQNVVISNIEAVGGGCINSCFKVETNQFPAFVKINEANKYPSMLQIEAASLKFLSNKSSFKIPKVHCQFIEGDRQVLILSWIKSKEKKESFWQDFAEKLTILHKQTNANFGFDFNNYIGSLKQSNKPHHSFHSFFIEERLKPQIELASNNKLLVQTDIKQFENLYNKLEKLFPIEPPALIHGDLWSGNFMADGKGDATIFDPAIYFGHREMELSFMQLFGGFDKIFLDTYNEIYPLQANFNQRKDIYNLYPLLVHLNLFGGAYYQKISTILKNQ